MKADARPRRLAVAVPVANLRRKPADAPLMNVHDDLQATQLLFNELLLLKDEEGGWFRVEAIEQQKSLGAGAWEGCPGWVRKRDIAEVESPEEYNGLVRSAFTVVVAGPSPLAARLFPLSLGTRLLLKGEATKGFFQITLPHRSAGWVPKKDVARRGRIGHAAKRTGQELAGLARLFLGVPYFWGGRSMPLPWSRGPIMGVDCSGLVNLVFRAHDIDVPRDAHDQWTASRPTDAGRLSPGDLIFLSREGDPGIVNHVMLSLGGEQFIEASQTGDIVRIRTFADKFGLDLGRLAQQDFFTNRRKLYFGSIGAGSQE
jgi:cell wall-associated NlpC family hydrolase